MVAELTGQLGRTSFGLAQVVAPCLSSIRGCSSREVTNSIDTKHVSAEQQNYIAGRRKSHEVGLWRLSLAS